MPIEPIKTVLPRVPAAGEKKEEKKGVTLPPPPEPVEPYAGYGTELQATVQSAYQAGKRVEESYKKLESVQRIATGSPLLQAIGMEPLFKVNEWGIPTSEEDYQSMLSQAQADFDATTRELRSAEWQIQVLSTLPAYLSSRKYTIRTADDILALIPNETLSDADRQWLERTLSRMEHLNNILPADFEGTVAESQAKMLEEILSEPKRDLRAVHNLTVEELQKSFQPFAIDLPEGLSAGDVRNIMSQMQLEDETEKELSAYLLERASEWAKETERLSLLRAGLLRAESPELTPLEFAKLMFVQPLMGGLELLNKYFDMLPRPLSSAAIIGVHNLFQTPDDTMAGRMHDIYQHYRSMGESAWSSYAKAINEVEAPWWLRMGIETAFDPTSYIGLGIATSAATKTGSLLSRLGLRTVGSRIGPFVGSIENGFIRASDAVFIAGKEVVLSPVKGSFWLAGAGYQIPRTLTQMSRNFARQTSMNFKSVLDRMYPNVRNLQGLTAADIRLAAEQSIDAAINRPTEGLDLMVKAGSELLEFEYVGQEAAGRLLKEIVPEGFEFDVARLARLNDEVLNMFSGQTQKITAGNILTKMGLGQTDEAVEKLVSRLAAFRDDVVDDALRMFRPDAPNDQLIGMFNRMEANRYANLSNPISTHMTQAGQVSSWVSRVADRVLYSSHLVALERKVIMPFARWNLLFANFGPFNFLENMQRSFLGGAEIMYPRSYSGVAETNRLFRGLTNAPYELQMAERGIARMEMALIDPKTGTTSAFRGGKIPFVTREVTVGGKTIGKTINIRGVDYKLTDMQAYNDMWEQLTTIQRAYDYQVHYMKALPEVAPAEMQQITEAVLRHRGELEQITKFSPNDMRDIERTIIQDSTVGPDAILAHQNIDALEMERRQISKELGKVFDKCPEVRTATKNGIRNEVLDGSIFTDIDGRVAAFAEAEREMNLASLANQIDALKAEADDFTRIYAGKASLLDQLQRDIKFGEPKTVAIPGVEFQNYPLIIEGREVGSVQLRTGGAMAKPDELVIDTLTVTESGLVNKGFMGDVELLIHNLAKEKDLAKVTIVAKKEHNILYAGGGYKKVGIGYSKATMEPNMAPKNLDEMLGDMENISAMQEAVSERIHDYRRLTELRSQKLKPGKEVDDFHIGSNKLLGQFMEESETSMNRIIDSLRNFAKTTTDVPLTDAQRGAVDALAEIYRLENRNVLATRNRLAEIESKITRTPRNNRNARFWQQQRVAKAEVWDEHTVNARRLRNLRLDSSRQFLGSVGKPAFVPDNIPPVTRELTPSHIAHLFGVSGDDVYRGLTRVHHHVTVRPREDFIDYVRSQASAYSARFQKSAADIGFTDEAIGEVYDQLWRNLGIEPSALAPDSPTMLQMEEIRQELNRLHAAVRMDETDIAKWRQYISGVSDDVGELSMYKGVRAGTTDWFGKKEAAMGKARVQHELAYPTYDDANIIDESMRAIFPFWTYEAFRWRWIPRTWMRTPGTLTGLARYVDYTDGGYIPIPGTDLQINPLRGSVWMGGLRRFWLKDFPEYYDAFPGMEFIDYIGRAGFYPGIHVMAPVVAFGALAQKKPEMSEIAPTWVKSGMSALRALSPEHIGKVLDVVYPDRFRDFQTMLTLGELGYDADAIWRKKEQGIKLTEEEEKLWLRAEAKANGLKGILMEQTGLFRIRPQEYEEVRRSMRLAIEEATGVPVRIQERIDRLYPTTGKRFSDYYKLDVLQQKLLFEFEAYRRWQGITTPLYPSSWQMMEIKTKDYYETLEKNSHEARYEGVYEDGELVRPSIVDINEQLVNGVIGPDQWRSMREKIVSSLGEVGRALGDTPAYKDVPKTLEEREAWMAEKGVPLPTYGADQELLWYYYELEPEYTYNWESDRMELDFDTYYAKIDILLESLDEAHRQRLLDRIQLDWTPMERLYWTISREYFRPYRNIRNIVLEQYTDEQKRQIRRYEVARGAEREQLKQIQGPDGQKLIAGFNAKVREARQRLRYIDPELDAWSYFFGSTDSFITKEAQDRYKELVSERMNLAIVQ